MDDHIVILCEKLTAIILNFYSATVYWIWKNQIKSNQIQNIQRFYLDLKSFLTQWFDLDLPWFSLKIQIKPNQIKKKKVWQRSLKTNKTKRNLRNRSFHTPSSFCRLLFQLPVPARVHLDWYIDNIVHSRAI
jgi:hypothetical protein